MTDMTGDLVAVRGPSAAEADPDRGPRRTVAAMVGVVITARLVMLPAAWACRV